MNCDGCQHHHADQEICLPLSGHMLCKRCDKPFSANTEDRPLSFFRCPKCNERGSSDPIEDVAQGRSDYCPGFVQRVSLLVPKEVKPAKKTVKKPKREPSPQMELF